MSPHWLHHWRFPLWSDAAMGKDWAKGLTAASDPRVERSAVARRGLRYVRHMPVEQDRRLRAGWRTLPLEWSDTMAYVVGLMATDGCLSGDRRHLFFDSNDRQLVEVFLTCLGRANRYRTVKTRTGNDHFQAAFGDVDFYRWLLQVGLTPRKSLTMGAVHVPDEFIIPFARGLFDGDGHLANFTHAPTRVTAPAYRYERLWLYFNCGSRAHLEWLRERLKTLLDLDSYLEVLKARPDKNEFYRLKLGNRASVRMLTAFYADQAAPRLERKWLKWNDYFNRHLLA